MDILKRHIRLLFRVGLILSVSFPLGILGIVFGAIQWKMVMFALSLALVVFCMFTLPFVWIRFADRVHDRKILGLIESGECTSVSQVAARTRYRERYIRVRIKKMIFLGLLHAYLLPNDDIAIDRHHGRRYNPYSRG